MILSNMFAAPMAVRGAWPVAGLLDEAGSTRWLLPYPFCSSTHDEAQLGTSFHYQGPTHLTRLA